MQDQLYRLNTEMLGIISTDWRRMTVKIPEGSTITVVNSSSNGSRMVDILWEGDTVMIFVQDLRERGTLPAPYNSLE
jgi:ABC-type metal ion transport system substrate-binding protein